MDHGYHSEKNDEFHAIEVLRSLFPVLKSFRAHARRNGLGSIAVGLDLPGNIKVIYFKYMSFDNKKMTISRTCSIYAGDLDIISYLGEVIVFLLEIRLIFTQRHSSELRIFFSISHILKTFLLIISNDYVTTTHYRSIADKV
jgi:hypothetical protein